MSNDPKNVPDTETGADKKTGANKSTTSLKKWMPPKNLWAIGAILTIGIATYLWLDYRFLRWAIYAMLVVSGANLLLPEHRLARWAIYIILIILVKSSSSFEKDTMRDYITPTRPAQSEKLQPLPPAHVVMCQNADSIHAIHRKLKEQQTRWETKPENQDKVLATKAANSALWQRYVGLQTMKQEYQAAYRLTKGAANEAGCTPEMQIKHIATMRRLHGEIMKVYTDINAAAALRASE
jgi:hypothetical protein